MSSSQKAQEVPTNSSNRTTLYQLLMVLVLGETDLDLAEIDSGLGVTDLDCLETDLGWETDWALVETDLDLVDLTRPELAWVQPLEDGELLVTQQLLPLASAITDNRT